MNNELELISSNLDQPIPIETEPIFAKIDRIIDTAIATKQGWAAIESCRQLYEIARLSSISLAKFLHGIISNWDKFGIDEDVYAVIHDKLGIHHNTIVRYAEAWDTIPEIPEEQRETIIGRGIADLLKVSKMLNSGYKPTEEQWSNIANASDRMDFQEQIREVTHEKLSERAITPQMEMNGDIYVYHLGEKHYVGKLDTASGVYAVQKTIYRMCVGGGVVRK